MTIDEMVSWLDNLDFCNHQAELVADTPRSMEAKLKAADELAVSIHKGFGPYRITQFWYKTPKYVKDALEAYRAAWKGE